MNRFAWALTTAALAVAASATGAHAAPMTSTTSGRSASIPVCAKKIGTVAIAEPEKDWWSDARLGSPEALIKTFVLKSGCFGLVDRGRGLAARSVERALGDSGELRAGSNVGKAQVKTADYVIVPDLVMSNNKASGGGVGGLGSMLGGLTGSRTLGALGGFAGGLNLKKKEANVTLTLVNVRTTEQEALTEGHAKKSNISLGGGGFSDGLGAGVYGYSNSEIGQVISLAYLDAYTKLVQQLGGSIGGPQGPSR